MAVYEGQRFDPEVLLSRGGVTPPKSRYGKTLLHFFGLFGHVRLHQQDYSGSEF